VPLIFIFLVIIGLVLAKATWQENFQPMSLMLDFMTGFFLVFGSFKLIKLSAFAEAYGMYDVISMCFKPYAYLYPFIEISLGVAFLFRFEVVIVSWITLILMLINAFGAYKGIRDKKVIMCACMGTVFKLPMSYVTLGEDLLMAAMAVITILLLA
jgi:hypothetical protein